MKTTFRMTALVLLILLLGAATALAAPAVPLSTAQIPSIPACSQAPKMARIVQDGDVLRVTFEEALPSSVAVGFICLHQDGTVGSTAWLQESDATLLSYLPSGGQWLRIELAWTSGGHIHAARYQMGGSVIEIVSNDGSGNSFRFNGQGVFCEYNDHNSGVWTRFDTSGNATCYSYETQNMRVWFDFAGNVLWATYKDDRYECTWEPGTGWFIEAPAGNLFVRLDLDPAKASPLVIVAEPSPTPEVIWYPNNTIGLAGLSLQEASASLPNKWYNVVPVDLTRQGRQTYFLVISDAYFIGECHVDVWGDEVTVTCDVLTRSGIEKKSEYGRWFLRLGDISTRSIEATEKAIPFGEPLSISHDLGGADVALLFIRSKATYRQPFRDGTELPRYWRNTPDWKQFRKDLQTLMPYIDR